MYSFSLDPVFSSKTVFATILLKILGFCRFPSLPALRPEKPDNSTTAYLLHVIEKGQVVFNIGRQEASALYFLSQKVGSTGRIIAFEQHKATYDYLKEAKQLLNWSNVTIENTPLSAKEKQQTVTLSKKERPATGATIIRFDVQIKQKEAGRKEPPTLTGYCTVNQVYPGILKVDADGDEFEILSGALDILKSHKPKILVTCEERKAGREKIRSLFRLLTAMRYTGYFMFDTMLLPLDNFDFDVYQNPCSDFYCSSFLFT